MGILDFDNEKILRERSMPRDKSPYNRRWQENEMEDNFARLQNEGHEENSQDFADSPFADRAEEEN